MNGASGTSDIDGKAARVAGSETGVERIKEEGGSGKPEVGALQRRRSEESDEL
jgi:hypothetical protein